MLDDLKEEVELNLAQLHLLLQQFEKLRMSVCTNDPDDMEIAALAAFLHSFYNGIENAFKRIAKIFDPAFRHSEAWHSDLLSLMGKPANNRPSVIDSALQATLKDYLDFRHKFRHAYTFELQWTRMKPLVLNAEETLTRFEKQVLSFLLNIR